ncbi:27-O-demethylrifamycin SV methyltransferase [Nocardioides maradonensis]
MTQHYTPAEHYNRVTRAWALLLGAELHYGVFERPDEPLDEATHHLTERMAAGARFEQGDTVLDIGCGTGAQARWNATEHGVEVLGITTSSVGVQVATEASAAAGLADRVRFEERDGTANGLPDSSFDRVWILESSHLMDNRVALVEEAARVLRPGGRLVWCDLVRHRDIPFAELRERRHEFATLREGFGNARMEPLDSYVSWFQQAGLVVETADDLTQETLPTFDAWRANAERNRSDVVELLGERGHETFVRSCDILEGLWRDGTFGYGLVAAVKPA